MSRKPVHLQAATGRPTARDAVWAAIRRLKTFTLPGLADAARVVNATVRDYLTGLEAAGIVQRDGKAEYEGRQSPRFVLVRDAGVEAPRVRKDGSEVTQGAARDQMWRAMKGIGEFDADELALAASLENSLVDREDARNYIHYLHKAKYLACVHAGQPGRLARYRLLTSKISGPKAPMVQRVRQVFDPNLGAVVWQEPSKDPLEALMDPNEVQA